MTDAGDTLIVIPGRAEGASPESKWTSVWIPGPPP